MDDDPETTALSVHDPHGRSMFTWLRALLKEGTPAAVREALKEIPFWSAAEALVLSSREEVIRQEAQEVLRLIFEATTSGDEAEFLLAIAKVQEKATFHRALDSAFEKMRMCVEERAKPSLAVLASMEMFSATFPAVFYRRASSMIANATYDVLRSVKQIANGYGQFIEELQTNARTRFVGRVTNWKDTATAFNIRGDADGAAWFVGIPGGENQEWSVSGVEICPGQWHEVRNHMITHGFGTTFDDSLSVNGGDWSGVAEWMFLDYHDTWMRGLSQCLRIDS